MQFSTFWDIFRIWTLSLRETVSPTQNISKIFNQYVVKPYELPFQVSLYNITPTFLLCGGCLINPLYIVTSAHCVYGQNIDNMAAVAGIRHVLKNMENRSALSNIRSIKDIIIYPEFNPRLCDNDIALVRLELSFQITEELGYACLPPNSLNITQLLNKRKTGTIFGYALFNKIKTDGKNNAPKFWRTSQLLKFKASLVDTEECRIMYRNISYDIKHDQICAYALFSLSESTVTHSLDSSSPLVIDNLLIGIQSSVPNLPIFTQVSSYNVWIAYNVEKNSKNDSYPTPSKLPNKGLHFCGI